MAGIAFILANHQWAGRTGRFLKFQFEMRVQDGPKRCGDLSTGRDELMGKSGYTQTSKQGQGTFSGSKSSQDGSGHRCNVKSWLHKGVADSELPTGAGSGLCSFPNHSWDLFAIMLANPTQHQPCWQLTVLVFNSPALPLCNLLVKIPLSGHFSSEGWVCRLLLFRAWSQHLPHLTQHTLLNNTVNKKTTKSTLHPLGTPASGTAMSGLGGTSPTDKFLGRVQPRHGKGRFGNLSCY